MDVSGLTKGAEAALSVIESKPGIHQSQLCDALNVTSRAGARIAIDLEVNDLVSRTKIISEGNITYQLTPAGADNSKESDQPSVDEHYPDTDFSPAERETVKLLLTRDSVLQSQVWKQIGISSRTASRAASDLADAGIIEREETISPESNRETYRLTLVDADSEATDSKSASDAESNAGDYPATDVSTAGPVLSDSERDALQYISDVSGVPQTSLYSQVDADERAINEAIEKLLDKDLIERRVEEYYGRKTYWIKPTASSDEALA